MTIVSKLRERDIPLLRSFILDAWQMAGPSAFGWTGATHETINEIASESYLRKFLENPELKVFISKIVSTVVGFCAIRKIKDTSIELAGIIVRQDRLGKGVGTSLFDTAKREAIRTGFKTMLVKTESTNTRAISFYRSKGFVEHEQLTEEVNGTKLNLTVLTLDLSKNVRV